MVTTSKEYRHSVNFQFPFKWHRNVFKIGDEGGGGGGRPHKKISAKQPADGCRHANKWEGAAGELFEEVSV